MTKIYGVVLIGCGNIGNTHIKDIYFRDNIRIVGVTDLDGSLARLTARKYGAPTWSTDYRTLISRRDADIAIIATNVDTHLSILRDCVDAGIHAVCEKPIATNLNDGKQFYELVVNSKTKVLVSHVLRHNKTYNTVKKLIDAGAIGSLKLARMTQNHHAVDWNRYKRLLRDCSPIVDCAVHYIDVLQWFSDSRVLKVSGIGGVIGEDVPSGMYNYGIINMTLANGVIGYYEAGWGQTFPSSNIKEFIGDEGNLRITLNACRGSDIEEGDLIELYSHKKREHSLINVQSEYKNMWGQLQTLIAMIEHNASATPTIDEVFNSFYVALMADKAIRTNSIIEI